MHSKLLQHLPYDLNFIYLFFLSLWFVFFRLVFLSDGTHTVASPMATSEGPAVEPFPGFLWAAFHPWVQFRMLDLLKLLGITLAAFGAVNAASPAPLSESRIGGIGQVLRDPEWFLAAGMALWGQLGWQQMWACDGKYKKCLGKKKRAERGRSPGKMDGENTAEGRRRRRHPGLLDVSYVQLGNSLAQGNISLL